VDARFSDAATLALGASCTVKLTFAPGTVTTPTSYGRTLTVSGTGATAPTNPQTVSLTGSGVVARAPMLLAPNPLVITLPTGGANVTGTRVVTLTNNAPVGGAQVAVTAVAAAPINLQYAFTIDAGTSTCTQATLAPQASCSVTVRFTNLLAPRGATRIGTITFTDNGVASVVATGQQGALQGFATP